MTGCLMINASSPDWQGVLTAVTTAGFPLDTRPGHGLESSPHITVLYGIDGMGQINPGFIAGLGRIAGFESGATLHLQGPQRFGTEGVYAVAYAVEGDFDLEGFHTLVKDTLENLDLLTEEAFRFPEYRAHATVGYFQTQEDADACIALLLDKFPFLIAEGTGLQLSFRE